MGKGRGSSKVPKAPTPGAGPKPPGMAMPAHGGTAMTGGARGGACDKCGAHAGGDGMAGCARCGHMR